MRAFVLTLLAVVGLLFAPASASAAVPCPVAEAKLAEAQTTFNARVAKAKARSFELGVAPATVQRFLDLLPGGVSDAEEAEAVRLFNANPIDGITGSDLTLVLSVRAAANNLADLQDAVDDCTPATSTAATTTAAGGFSQVGAVPAGGVNTGG